MTKNNMNKVREQKFINAISRFKATNDRLAKKYGMKITMSIPGEKEVILADGRKNK